MISYHNDFNNPENSFVNVIIENVTELENIVADIHIMCNVVINCIAVRYVEELCQEEFTYILKEQLADMLYEYGSDLQSFKHLTEE